MQLINKCSRFLRNEEKHYIVRKQVESVCIDGKHRQIRITEGKYTGRENGITVDASSIVHIQILVAI